MITVGEKKRRENVTLCILEFPLPTNQKKKGEKKNNEK